MFKKPRIKPIPSDIIAEDIPQIVEHPALQRSHSIPLGVGRAGEVSLDLKKNSHILLVGSSGFGISTLTNTIMSHLLTTPEDWEIYALDRHRVELSQFKRFARVQKIVSEDDELFELVEQIVGKMHTRYRLMEELGARHIDEVSIPLPSVMFILQTADYLEPRGTYYPKDLEMKTLLQSMITELVRKGSAVGIHLMFSAGRTSPFLDTLKDIISNIIVMQSTEPLISRHVLGTREGGLLGKIASRNYPRGRAYLRIGLDIEEFQSYLTRNSWFDKLQ